MSESTRNQIAVLQHKRKQDSLYGILSSISDQLGESRHEPVESAISLHLQSALYARLKEMRTRGVLRSDTYKDAESAVGALLEYLEIVKSRIVFEVYADASGSGFFTGLLSRQFLMSCLNHRCEGIAVISQDLDFGVILDVAHDDPLLGNFYEVERW